MIVNATFATQHTDMAKPASVTTPPAQCAAVEDLHELTRDELRLTNLVTTDAVAEVLPRNDGAGPTPVAALS